MKGSKQTQSSWWQEVSTWLLGTAASVEQAVDSGWRRLGERLGLNQPVHIQVYHGFANPKQAWVSGRVLANKPAGGPKDDDTWWDNLLNTYRRWESDEVPGAWVEAVFAGQTLTAKTDEEGYYHLKFSLAKPLEGELWHPVQVRLLEPSTAKETERLGECRTTARGLTATGKVLVPPAAARFGVISDLDDTVIQTHITDLLTAAKLTFLHNAKTRKPLAGVAELYQALHLGPQGSASPDHNPIFYVSSSPWNLYDLLVDFLELNAIPAGPLLLRDLGISEQQFISGGHNHKLESVNRILTAYPTLPFVLIGDSGQEDAQLYWSVIQQHGSRIKAVYIRDVDPLRPSERDEQVRVIAKQAETIGVPMRLVTDSVMAAQHAAGLGLIASQAIVVVGQECEQDLQRKSMA